MAWFIYVRGLHQWHASWNIYHDTLLHHFYRNWKYRSVIRAGKVTFFQEWNRKSNLVFEKLVSSLMWLEFAFSVNGTLTICLNCAMERRIQNPVKLRCLDDEDFCKISFSRFQLLTILTESSILVVRLDYQCTSVTENKSCIR